MRLMIIRAGAFGAGALLLVGCAGAPTASVTVTETAVAPSATVTFTQQPEETPTAPVVVESSPSSEETSIPVPEATTYKGSGTKIVKITKPEDGPVLATFTHDGGSNFAVWSLDSNLEQIDLLVNTIGGFSGTTLLDRYDGESTARVEVEADGAWTIKFEPLSAARQFTDMAQGEGPDVLVYQGPAGVATLKNQGESNFAVWFFNADSSDLAANEIGNYTGEAVMPVGPTAVQVESDGKWSISLE